MAVEPILKIIDLQVSYYTDAGRATALAGATLSLNAGEKLGLVGESGSGKSTMALAMMRMIKPPGRIEHGEVIVGDIPLTSLSDEVMRKARLNLIAYIPQGAMNSLNPVMRIGAQMVDAIKAHDPKAKKSELVERCMKALESVDLKRSVYQMYAHELSGGMKQRVCIAISILLKPRVIICDEPTSALDVVTQRQVMETIERVQKEIGAAVILIGHDMGLMAQSVNRLAVMYAGHIMEVGEVNDIFSDPLHPYTRALIRSLPRLGKRGLFEGIPGIPPSVINPPPGCPFTARCPEVVGEICSKQAAPLVQISKGRWVSCHIYDGAAK
jgi:oligopeptide/dipeptide ABC transporter ATP-binding protein